MLLSPQREDLEAGERLLTEALEIRRRVLAANHPDIAVSLGALAEHYRRRGELERSRELYRQALAVFRDPAERHHPRAVKLMNDYAALLGIMKEYAEAETLQREAIAIGRQVLGADTLAVANLTNNLAVTLTSLGRLGDAERAFREAFDQQVSLLGEDHWRVRNNARNIGRILTLQEQYDEALPWMDRAVAIGMNRATAEDPGLEGMRSQRAWILFRLGRRAEALEAVTAAVSALERMKQPNDGYALAFSRVLRARILVGMGRPDQAEASATRRFSVVRTLGSRPSQLCRCGMRVGTRENASGRHRRGKGRVRAVPAYLSSLGSSRPRNRRVDRTIARRFEVTTRARAANED